MRVVLADSGIAFDGLTPEERPLGGAESAFVALAEAFAESGAETLAFSNGARAMRHKDVAWAPLTEARLPDCDLYIANRAPQLIGAVARPLTRSFWIHNPAHFLRKPRYLWPILRYRPTMVFAGPSHLATQPFRLPVPQAVIPLGVEKAFLTTPRPDAVPPPRAVFLSNPLRGLEPLLSIWRAQIRPSAPQAELHLFSGPQVYAGGDARARERARQMETVLRQAESMADEGVVLRTPLAKAALAKELSEARVLLYLGDIGETFCLAVAEAQAMGVPAVVRPVGAVAERVRHGETGFVAQSDQEFASSALSLLTDDSLWSRMSRAAMAQRSSMSWRDAALAFGRLQTKSR